MEMIRQFFRETSGATMVEYALMIAFIALACFLTLGTLGANLQGVFNTVAGGFGS